MDEVPVKNVTYEKFNAYAAYTEDASTVPADDFFPAVGVECEHAGAQAKKYNGTTEDYDVNYWLINHKYLYTLVFKMDEIIFDPKVEAFVEVSDINIDLPYQN